MVDRGNLGFYAGASDRIALLFLPAIQGTARLCKRQRRQATIGRPHSIRQERLIVTHLKHYSGFTFSSDIPLELFP